MYDDEANTMSLRASILEVQSVDGVDTCLETEPDTKIYSFAKLRQFLDETDENNIDSPDRRLFIIETECATDSSVFKDLRRQLRAKLGVSKDIFRRHRWSQTTFRFNEVINCPRLPTTTRPKRAFSLEYFELWQVAETDRHVFDYHNPGTVECVSTGRQIQCYKWIKETDRGWLMVAPRKCSFWSKQHGDGWTVVIICDPAPKFITFNKDNRKTRANLELQETKAFEKGYHGFIPDNVSGTDKSAREKAPHKSFLDDLRYYFKTYSEVLGQMGDPASAAVFPRKLVASNYCQLLGFVSHQTASMRSSGWAAQRRTQEDIDESNQVETAWSQFKCPEYLEALGAVLDSLGIPQGHEPYDTVSTIEPNSTSRTQELQPGNDDWLSSTPDFLYLHREFRAHLADYARMTSSLAALNGMIGGRIAMLEARTARSLTLVAMIFAPPALVASILSIPSRYTFGDQGPKFWWYWAAAIPLTIVVLLVTYLVNERDAVIRLWRAEKPQTQKAVPRLPNKDEESASG